VGLLVGDALRPCRRVLLCVDLTRAVLAEARRRRAALVMAYHPLIFKPISRLTAAAAPIAYEAIRAGIAVYSVNTAFDVAPGGANDALADALGMGPLETRCAEGEFKLAVYLPPADLAAVAAAAFGAGAGRIGNYSECSFRYSGTGTFRGNQGTHPAVGEALKLEETSELCWETVCPRRRLAAVLAAIRAAHSYEEPAIDVMPLADAPPCAGLGRVGELTKPVGLAAMLQRIRRACGVKRVQLARPAGRRDSAMIRTLAVGAGSCGDLFRRAAAAKADLYITGELRHHDALAAVAAGLSVICVGHSNSERLTLGALAGRLRAEAPGLEVMQANEDSDPFVVV
jgi:dinuclear metal center YbgI/SA1388 family protein